MSRTTRSENPRGLSASGSLTAVGEIFGYCTKEYQLSRDVDRGGKWKEFEEFPGYLIRPCSTRVVEIRKAGSDHSVSQYPIYEQVEDGWNCYLYVKGIRTKVDLKQYWKKYSNKTCLAAFKRFIAIGRG